MGNNVLFAVEIGVVDVCETSRNFWGSDYCIVIVKFSEVFINKLRVQERSNCVDYHNLITITRIIILYELQTVVHGFEPRLSVGSKVKI